MNRKQIRSARTWLVIFAVLALVVLECKIPAQWQLLSLLGLHLLAGFVTLLIISGQSLFKRGWNLGKTILFSTFILFGIVTLIFLCFDKESKRAEAEWGDFGKFKRKRTN